MRVLIAFDKFKDSLTARDACQRTAAALSNAQPEWALDLCPLTDGGEGFTEILTGAVGGSLRTVSVSGPRGTPVEASYGLVDAARIPAAAKAMLGFEAQGRIAVIEMAQASGLALLPPDQRDPWHTTTLGTGEVIRHALAAGANAVLLGVGGSATHDLGLGALSALGFSFLTPSGNAVLPPVPARWGEVVTIEGGVPAGFPPLRIACDVTNPLLGTTGAAAVYGPQKGLRPEDLAALETASDRMARLLCKQCAQPAELADLAGAGAAGGCSFGLMAGAGARLLPGYAFVTAWLDLERRLAQADVVITGEGRFDESSLSGKGPGALAAQALALGRTVHVFAGAVTARSRPGLQTHALSPADLPLAQALRETGWRLEDAARAAFGAAPKAGPC